MKQRPDLFLPNLSTAFEFQCSTIPTEAFAKRTCSYRKANMDPLWILGAKRLTRIKNSNFYRLDELAFQSLRFNTDCSFSPYLIYFCPLPSSFTFLHSIIPYSSRTVLAANQSIPLKHTHFPFYMNELKSPVFKNFYKEWIEKVITTRLYLHVNKDPAVIMMKKHLLNKGVSISLFPIEAVIPSKHLFWFHSPAYVWQTCFLMEILQPLPIGASFQFREVYRTFISTIKFFL
ncbi:competence protein CoiA family protein [Pseudalkalibacillus sp. A8]|uniref:competence protein CoiA family protein n=1 Tax=Pseudalkalibacillus sp. A8 TaxID=3382641 RepID=UPI0038B4F067